MGAVDAVEWACVLCGCHIQNDWVEQYVCIKLEHSSVETILMVQKATALGNWWLAASSQQCTLSHITSRVEFFGETSNHPGDSATRYPRFGVLWLLAFPKTKITFEKSEVSDCHWDSAKYDGTADDDWENCVRSQGAYFEGDWGALSYVQCFLYLVSCSKISLSFISHGWISSGQTSYTAHVE